MILLTITFGLVVLYIFWYYNDRKYQKHLKVYPGPTLLSTFKTFFSSDPSKDFLDIFLKLHSTYGEIVNFPFGFSRKLLICGVKPLEFLLSSNVLIDKGEDYRYFRRWFGNSSVVASGNNWRERRKLLNPGFHFSILDNFVEVFDKQSSVLVKKLEKISGSFDICPLIKLYSLDVICAMVKITMNRMLSPLKSWDFTYIFTAEYKKELKLLKYIHNFSNSVIEKRIRDRSCSNLGFDKDLNKKPSFLDILLSSKINGKPVPQEIIREEVDTFMFAEKCFEEIKEVVGTDLIKPITCNDLRQIKYLDQVIKESLRMYTPAVVISRSIKEDTYYQGQLWPKNLQITIFLYGLHHQSSVYPNPEVFDPERFSLENSKKRSLYSYLPFSAGPRNCIGQKFAFLLIKSTAANILRNFKILPDINHQPILKGDSLLHSENGLSIQLQKRM
ncbi:hypothetical protein FQR65_LT03766 [Abscondita terminalis]|nr:hypothetical protein FQR65_LT03766 [Abscondita terminalis]